MKKIALVKLQYKFLQTLLSIGFSLVATAASAHIPSSDTIIDRIVKNQSPSERGYQLKMQVRLESEAEKLVFEEVWTIRNDLSMRLRLTGKSPLTENFTREYVYDGNIRYRINENGDLVSVNLGNDHFERYFHFRDKDRFKDFLLAGQFIQKIELPEPTQEFNPDGTPIQNENLEDANNGTEAASANQEEGDALDDGEESLEPEIKVFHNIPEPFTKLTRVAGVIAYAFGIPTPVKSQSLLPRMWVEQDRFHIRKIRTGSQTTMSADSYTRTWRIDFPRNRVVKWKSNQVEVNLLEIKKIVVGPKTKKALLPSSLKDSPFVTKNEMVDTLGGSIMKEFYQRFR